MGLRLDFLGTDAVTPAAGEDTACLLINGRVLVDVGWHSPASLARLGLSPSDLAWVLLTHLHHDHYMALPQLLFWRWMKAADAADSLHIAGPAEDLRRVIDLSMDFLQGERFGARLDLVAHPLAPGDRFEAAGLRVSTARTRHPVPSLCYRLDDPESGASLAYTGDTAYEPGLVDLVAGVDVLVHEASLGARAGDGSNVQWGHSGAPDAARLASLAGVRRLLLTHAAPSQRQAAVATARALFADAAWAPEDQPLLLSP